MTLDDKADELAHQLAELEGVSVEDAVLIAVQEALERRKKVEPFDDIVKRLLKTHGITPSPSASQPLPKSVFDEMSGDEFGDGS